MKKRLVSLALVLPLMVGLFTVPAHAGTAVEIVTAEYEKGQLCEPKGGLAAIQRNGSWGLVDKTGAEVIPCQYEDIKGQGLCEGLVALKRGGKWGFLDKTGQEVIAFQYEDAGYFDQGLAAVRRNGKWGYVDKTGREVVPCIYDDFAISASYETPIHYQGDGSEYPPGSVATISFPDGRQAFADWIGKEWQTVSRHETPSRFSDGLAAVRQDGKWGFVDTTGREVVPCIYDYKIEKHMHVKPSDDTTAVISTREEVPFFVDGLAAVKRNGKWGFVDATGREVIPCEYKTFYYSPPHGMSQEQVPRFFDGIVKLYLNDQSVTEIYFDKTGREVYARSGYMPSEGLVAAKQNGKWGFVDEAGAEVIPYQYDEVYSFSEGLAAVKIGGKWGFINKAGAEVISCQYDDGGYYVDDDKLPYRFSEGLAVVCRGELRGLVNKTGVEVSPCQYDRIGEFQNGVATVMKTVDVVRHMGSTDQTYLLKKEQWGAIDTTGREIVPCVYEEKLDFSSGFARVFKTGEKMVQKAWWPGAWWVEKNETRTVYEEVRQWGLIDKTGREIIPLSEDSISPGIRTLGEGLYEISIGRKADGYKSKSIVIDETGQEIVTLSQYDVIHSFSKGLTAVKADGKWGFIDRTGNLVIPCVLEGYLSVGEINNGMALTERTTETGKSLFGLVALYPDPFPAYASTQSVLVDGKAVEFQMYALKNAAGNLTNYVKLRDVASVLNGSAVQFNVGWDGAVSIETGKAYISNGSEMMTPYSGDRACEAATADTIVNGKVGDLDAIVLKDDVGGAYTYYKLRDLGAAIGFKVDWSAEKGIFIETK